MFKFNLGIAGAALSIGISYWFTVALLFLYIMWSPSPVETNFSLSGNSFAAVWDFLRVAVPSSLMLCLEGWTFEIIILLSGLLPNRQLETSVLAVCYMIVGLHFYIPYAIGVAVRQMLSLAALPNTSEERPGAEIHTLGNISPESCTKNFFYMVHNVKKLGVRGKLALLLDGKNDSSDSSAKLRNLEKLKLLNDVYPDPPSGVQLCGLPPSSKFPPNLKILTLSRTSLDRCHVTILGNLEAS